MKNDNLKLLPVFREKGETKVFQNSQEPVGGKWQKEEGYEVLHILKEALH